MYDNLARESANRWIISVAVCILVVLGTILRPISFLAFIICAGVIVQSGEKTKLCVLFMLMSFANIFKGAPGAQSFFTYLLLLYVLIHFIGKCYVPLTVLFVIMFGAGLVLVQLINGTLNVLRTIKFIANFLFLIAAVQEYKREWIKDISLFYIAGVILASITKASGIFPNVNLYLRDVFGEFVGGAQVYRFSGLYLDPNYYAINVILALCIIVSLYNKKMLSSTVSACLAGILTVFVGMTGSKSAFLMLLLPICLLLYSNGKNGNYAAQMVFLIALFIGMSFVLSGKVPVFNNVLGRFLLAQDANSLTTGRIAIWESYMKYVLNRPLVLFFGKGLGAGYLKGRAAHNSIIEIIYHMGVWGGLVSWGVLKSIAKTQTVVPKNLMNYGPVICVVGMSIFLSQLFSFDVVFQILLAIEFYQEEYGKSLTV